MNQLKMVNDILLRLREDAVESVNTNAYSQLVAMWINDGMAAVTDTFAFTSLKHEITIALVAGTIEYDLSATIANGGDVPNTGRTTSEDSMLIFQDTAASAFLFDDTSDKDTKARMRLITEDERYEKQQYDRTMVNLDPVDFSLKQTAEGDGLLFTVWPIPDAARTVRIQFWTPQGELGIDGSDDSTEIIVHNRTVIAYAHLIASNERGEEMGEPGNLLERRYLATLAATVELAIRNDERLNVYESYRD